MQLNAYAKINIFLGIKNKRKDGLHNILSVFQTISLHDKISIKKINTNNIIIRSNVKSLNNKKNLCYIVADLLKKRYNIKEGVLIKIHKKIPIGSGLGGASSDAFTTLKILNQFWKLKLKKEDILTLCKQIGSDVSFFYYGGCCLVEGTGNKITPIKPFWKKKPFWLLLIYPNRKLLTKNVYNKYDEITCKPSNLDKTFILKNLKRKMIDQILLNDLEDAATVLLPKLKKIKQEILNKGIKQVSMSGSGSTIYAILKSKKDAFRLKHQIANKINNCKYFIARSIFTGG